MNSSADQDDPDQTHDCATGTALTLFEFLDRLKSLQEQEKLEQQRMISEQEQAIIKQQQQAKTKRQENLKRLQQLLRKVHCEKKELENKWALEGDVKLKQEIRLKWEAEREQQSLLDMETHALETQMHQAGDTDSEDEEDPDTDKAEDGCRQELSVVNIDQPDTGSGTPNGEGEGGPIASDTAPAQLQPSRRMQDSLEKDETSPRALVGATTRRARKAPIRSGDYVVSRSTSRLREILTSFRKRLPCLI